MPEILSINYLENCIIQSTFQKTVNRDYIKNMLLYILVCLEWL